MTTCWASQAADNHAAREDAAEARAEFVALFADDAADEVLAIPGTMPDLLYHGDTDGKLEALLLAVLDAGNSEPLSLRVHAMREAMRAKVAGSSEVTLRSIKLADAHIAEMAEA